MRVDELDISDAIAEALTEQGFVQLHPPQAEAIPLALEGRNLLAAIPTASGKSLIGYIPALKTVLDGRGKVLYVVPLKALASEKAEDLRKFSDLGIKVGVSIGDLDSEDRGVADADILVATSEKADSMIRHGSRWIQDVALMVMDEIHMIHDPGRGPTLEVALTKMMRRIRGLQVIALSATVSNAEDLAEWLHADLVKSDWRPIPLKEGVFCNGTITFSDRTTRTVDDGRDAVWSLVKQTVGDGGQCLVFVNSRRSTESLATRFAKPMGSIAGKVLSKAESDLLEGDAETTAIGRKLASCVAGGVAFHHAGLTYRQRQYVEDNFRSGGIKCIVATPTLAAGINLPARRVIVRDTYRFDGDKGNVPIPVMEIKQMCGRAGRPGYDPYGEAVLVAKSAGDGEHLMEDYIEHDPEILTSKLYNDAVLRSHILGLIATGDADSEESIIGFLRDTFFGATSQLFGIESVVGGVVDFLADRGMVERQGDYIHILRFGKRVSDLYIDPLSASMLRDAAQSMDGCADPMPVLIAVSMTPDVLGMYPKTRDRDMLNALAAEYSDSLLIDPDDCPGYVPELFLSDLKVAALVSRWIDESSEEDVTEEFGVGPGDIRSKVDRVEWMVYALKEIAYILEITDAVRALEPLTTRIRYGVREELVGLVSLRGVGRTRARILFDNGVRTRSDVADMPTEKLAAIPGIGPSLAARMKEQTGAPPEPLAMTPSEEESMMMEMAAEYADDGRTGGKGEAGPRQASLFDF